MAEADSGFQVAIVPSLPPTLIVRETVDDQVPVESSRAAVRRLKADDVLVEVDGVGEQNAEFVAERVVEWITVSE